MAAMAEMDSVASTPQYNIYLQVLRGFFDNGMINCIDGDVNSVKFIVEGLVNEDGSYYIVKLYRSASGSEGITILLPGDPKGADHITLPHDKREFHGHINNNGYKIKVANRIPIIYLEATMIIPPEISRMIRNLNILVSNIFRDGIVSSEEVNFDTLLGNIKHHTDSNSISKDIQMAIDRTLKEQKISIEQENQIKLTKTVKIIQNDDEKAQKMDLS